MKTSLKCVRDYMPVLALLASKRVKPHVKKALLSCTNLQDVICSCALNILKGNIPLNAGQKTKLKRYKKILLSLASKNCSRSKKVKHISKLQSGGFFPLLAPLLGAVAGPLIQGIAGLFGANK